MSERIAHIAFVLQGSLEAQPAAGPAATGSLATNSSCRAVATSTAIADGGELRRPRGRSPWAQGESREDCGAHAVAALASAAMVDGRLAGRNGSASANSGQSRNGGASANRTEADMRSADAALTDLEVAACVYEEAVFVHAARRKGAKRRPARGGRAAGKRRRRRR